jgi:beta-glucosidase-like glycosyl hydrolase/CubicO group peptidase (beta-lactamase class C family)
MFNFELMANTKPPENKSGWADSVLNAMSLEEKIGQLFMVAAYSNRDEKHYSEIENLVKEHHIGGLIFFQGGPQRQAKLTNRYQKAAKIPLLIGIDGEWGLGMRLDSTLSFPKQMTIGALQDNTLIYKMGLEIGRQCRRMGIHVNFAPVVDINSNPLNPVIGYRSFGESKELVAEKAAAYMKGLQHANVMACAKHFPGHGDTDADSHYTLPVVNRSKKEIEATEFYPFKELIKDSLQSIMVAHLQMPALDNTPNLPTTLSKKVVTNLLKEDLNFEGLVFTDALNMKGVSKFFPPGEVELKAFLAGNDVLLFAENVPKAVELIKLALKKKQIRTKDLDRRVLKILLAKERLGLIGTPEINTNNLLEDLNSFEARKIINDIYAGAITLVKNDFNILPFKLIDTVSFKVATVGEAANGFVEMMGKYAPIERLKLNFDGPDVKNEAVIQSLKKSDVLVVSFHKLSTARKNNFGIPAGAEELLKKLEDRCQLVIVVFGTPYALKHFKQFKNVVCAYENNAIVHQITPQVLFGAMKGGGKLPVSADDDLKAGLGYALPKMDRLRFEEPEAVGLSSLRLKKIDSIAHKIIQDKATPGCQVLVAKDGAVVFNKSYGYLTYDSLQPVTNETLYDIASITKVASTLQAIMYLQERGKLDVHQKASYYLPDLVGTNKQNCLISEILVHQAGLQPFIPYWKRTMHPAKIDVFYCDKPDNNWFTHQVSDGMYAMKTMEDTLWKWVKESEMLAKNRQGKYDYKYSDLGFYILKRIAERQLNMPIEEFVESKFYRPLGLSGLMFNPRGKVPDSLIAPTEHDTLFRHSLIHGYVHDQGAAMFGGVGGHAGLFSTAYDLAVLMQMNMNKGYYGGKYFLLPQTVPFFAQRHFVRNRRGYGWDKPYIWGGDGPTSKYSSPSTFGHTGFTGTCVWADPEHNLIFVFLSNRVYPNADNVKLIRESIRPRIHDMVYEAMVTHVNKPTSQ